MVETIYRLPQVVAARSVCRTQLYLDIKSGLFPRPVKLGKRINGWPESEVKALNAARIAGKSDDAIKALVRNLELAREGALDDALRP